MKKRAVSVLAAIAVISACSSDKTDDGLAGAPIGAAGGGNGGTAGTADASVGGMGLVGMGNTAGMGGAVLNPGSAGGAAAAGGAAGDECNAFSQQPEQIIEYRDVTVFDTVYDTITDTLYDTIVTYKPVALYIMMDRSSSMVGVEGDPTSWPNANNAVTGFVNDPASAGLEVGLGFFPPVGNELACNNAMSACCTAGAECGQPIVPIAPIPANATALINGMQQAAPNPIVPFYTPTECALRGMIEQCSARSSRASSAPRGEVGHRQGGNTQT